MRQGTFSWDNWCFCAATARIEALACEKSDIETKLQRLQEQAAAAEAAHQRSLAEMVCNGDRQLSALYPPRKLVSGICNLPKLL